MTPPGVVDDADPLDLRLVPAALTAWLVSVLGILWPATAGPVVAIAGCTAAAAPAARRFGVPRPLVTGAWAIAVVAVGFGVTVGLRSEAVAHHPLTAAQGATVAVTVTPTESPVPAGSTRVMFRATLRTLAGQRAFGRVVVFAAGAEFDAVMVGRPISFRARVGRPHRRDLSVAVLTATGSPVAGRAGPVARAAHAVRHRFIDTARQVLPAEQAALLPGLVLGDTTAVPPPTAREFRAAGLTHLMAVSGANVTIVCGAVLLSARLVGPRGAVGLAAVALVGFVIVVQPTASVLRAAVMGAIALAGVVSARQRQAIPSLAAAVLTLLAVAPQLAVDVGFVLSVTATAALVVVAPRWSRRLVGRGWPKPVADATAIALAAHLVTAPLIAGISGRVSVVAAGANLAVAALIAPVTVLGSAAAVLCGPCPTAAAVLIRFTGPEVFWVGAVAHTAGGLAGATLPVPDGTAGALTVAAVSAALLVGWRWRWGRAAVGVGVLAVVAWSLAGLLDG
ncbi:ComEC/Rec2 family competence protein [Mycolicibacillus parakoreensis]|uniref:ComEC/Rec2 family competence protein n=1 Tax=Mycolicibacillus parakoreensis TaxID=1069221 RepID=A0ABY3U7X9_9MYCO|nr:ComEC/Rec2 family competence protein [Mycolicibacillus parakoreensis]MCV7314857.1 ComEC/Rec2 family competence protein [Mycolicibacillus parakoreensis]ULN53852.1 ComEC/Rec2 family competence protein [Mycolicibacillus parakoreensis]HLS00072.1 ComEC/Rec2 family competence protein [Mycolicibacillus parakoreensis]